MWYIWVFLAISGAFACRISFSLRLFAHFIACWEPVLLIPFLTIWGQRYNTFW